MQWMDDGIDRQPRDSGLIHRPSINWFSFSILCFDFCIDQARSALFNLSCFCFSSCFFIALSCTCWYGHQVSSLSAPVVRWSFHIFTHPITFLFSSFSSDLAAGAIVVRFSLVLASAPSVVPCQAYCSRLSSKHGYRCLRLLSWEHTRKLSCCHQTRLPWSWKWSVLCMPSTLRDCLSHTQPCLPIYNNATKDVHLTSDNVILMFHDPRLERTTDGTGEIAKQPYHNGIDAVRTKKEPHLPIPTFQQVLELLDEPEHSDVIFNIDVKVCCLHNIFSIRIYIY